MVGVPDGWVEIPALTDAEWHHARHTPRLLETKWPNVLAFAVQCPECGLQIHGGTREGVINLWNSRMEAGPRFDLDIPDGFDVIDNSPNALDHSCGNRPYVLKSTQNLVQPYRCWCPLDGFFVTASTRQTAIELWDDTIMSDMTGDQ